MKLLPSDPDIQTIVARIESGDLDLQPNFQRGEVWTEAKKKKLIDSILRDWHVPPIHVVVNSTGKQEVLDGQQRLVSIRDFVNDEFKVDGRTEPLDPAVQRLDGRYYSALPTEVRRAFDQFTIRIFRLVDYGPGEPGELFFRLNQMTHLTAAEQRNAFYGPVREQVRSLVQIMSTGSTQEVIGFSNRRMAYDDVFARLLCTLEAGTLGSKLGANEISSRYRSSLPISSKIMERAEESVLYLKNALISADAKIRFNKATLFTWLVFVSYFARAKTSTSALSDFLWMFEAQRGKTAQRMSETEGTPLTKLPPSVERTLLRIFDDRSSSRVSDVSSVIFRDLILWLFFYDVSKRTKNILPPDKWTLLKQTYSILEASPDSPERVLEENVEPSLWGNLK